MKVITVKPEAWTTPVICDDMKTRDWACGEEKTPSGGGENTMSGGGEGLQTFTEYVDDYLESTTVHGLRSLRDKNPMRRMLWRLVVLMSLAGVSYLAYTIGAKLRDPPVVTRISTDLRASLRLPAFTLCNYNLFNRSALLAPDFPLEVRLNIIAVTGDPSVPAVLADLGHNASDLPPVNWTAVNWTEVYGRAAHTRAATFSSAVLKSTEASILDNVTHAHTDKGICYTYQERHLVAEAGISGGVELVLNVHPQEYSYNKQDQGNEGFKIAFHEPGDVPILKESGINLRAGQGYLFGLSKARRMYSEGCVGATDSHRLRFHARYTRNNCIQECQAAFTVDMCSCRLIYQRADASLCQRPPDFSCAFRSQKEFAAHPRGLPLCACAPECETVKYNAAMSTTIYPSQYAIRIAEMSGLPSTDAKGQLQVSYFFESLEETTVEQIESYSFNDAWGDIGGVLGLCLGASLMTIVELREFSVGLITLLIAKTGVRKTTPR